MKSKDLCSYAPKSRIKAGEAVDNAKYLFFTSSADENKRYTDFQFDKEAIIMGTGGNATLHYHNGKFSVSTDCLVLLPDPQIKCKYLYYFFKSHMNVLEAGFKGAGLKHTNKKYIEDIEINKVPDLITQDRIISRLDKISENIEKLNRELGLFDSLVKARFVEMFGDTIDNPKGYLIHQLSEYITSLTSGSRGWAQYCVDNGEEWFITIKNVKNCHISMDNIQPVNAPDNTEAKRTKVQEGDLLISITADLGRTGVVTKEIAEHGAYINQHLSCVRLNRTMLNPLFVAYYMESPAGKEQFIAKNQSAVKAGLNFNSINSLKIMVPPLVEQDRFVDFVQQVDKSKLAVQKSLEKTQQLFDSLMQEYFG